jgi:hypothetical protein
MSEGVSTRNVADQSETRCQDEGARSHPDIRKDDANGERAK